MTDDNPHVEAWVCALADLLYMAPLNDRAAIVEALAVRVRAMQQEEGKLISFAEMAQDWQQSPMQRNWHAVMRLRSRIALACVRAVTNSHSRADAAAVLFQRHPGPGSGFIRDYLRNLPGLLRYPAENGPEQGQDGRDG